MRERHGVSRKIISDNWAIPAEFPIIDEMRTLLGEVYN
jgi:hypothetical protein